MRQPTVVRWAPERGEHVETGEQGGFDLASDGTWMVARLEIDQIEQMEPSLAARVLAEARQRLTATLRTGDRLAEASRGFWLGLAVAADDLDERLAGRVLDAVGLQPFDLGGGQFARRTASIGWAPFPWQPSAPEGMPLPEVRRVAVRALYLAQRSGRNQAVGMLPVDAEASATAVRVVRIAGPDLIDETPTEPLHTR